MKYLVRITETLCRDIIVDAEDKNEAYRKADNAYGSGDVELDYDDYCDSDIEVVREANKIDLALYEEIGG